MKRDHRFQALKAGFSIKPGLLKVHKLESYLPHCTNQTRLARAIAYSMTTLVSDRRTMAWGIAKVANPQSSWKSICVFSYVKQPKCLTDIVAVDFSILEQDSTVLPYLRSQVLIELELIWKKGSQN